MTQLSVSSVYSGPALNGLINSGRLTVDDIGGALVWSRDRGIWKYIPGTREVRINLDDIKTVMHRESKSFGWTIEITTNSGRVHSFKVGSAIYLEVTEALALLPINLIWDNTEVSSTWFQILRRLVADPSAEMSVGDLS